MSSDYPPSPRPHGHRPPSLFTAMCVTLVIFVLCGVAQPTQARLERQTYVAYRTPHLCSYEMMETVKCGGDKPMCCVASSAVRCCAASTSCGNCTDTIVGYEMPRSSVILGCFSLSVLVLLGSIIMSGVGRHLAWVLERRRVIENYRKRLALRRAEAREFKKELAETEEKDIEDTVACVICCARHIDVALTPCGHVCCCRFCAKRLRECPVCRAAVQRCFDLPLYYVQQLVKAAADEGEGVEDAAGATASPTATSAKLTAEGVGEETGVDSTRENQEAHAALSGARSSDAAQTHKIRPHVEGGDGDDDGGGGVEVEAAQTRNLNPFSRRRYTRLCCDAEDDAAGAADTVVPTSSQQDAAATTEAAAPVVAAMRRDGFISVEK